MPDAYLFRTALKDLLRLRKIALAALLAVLPAALVVLWRATPSGGRFQPETAYNILAGDLIFGFILVILAVMFGTGIISQEVDGKTIVYLLTRPVPRWRILALKFAAACLVITATVWAATLLLALACFGPAGLARSPTGHDLLILPLGVLAYGALFLLLAVTLKRPLLVGLLFAFGWESWVPNLPGSFQKVSLMSYLRVLAPHPKPENEVVDITSLLTAANPQTISHSLAVWVLWSVLLACLAAALVFFSSGEYVPRDDAE